MTDLLFVHQHTTACDEDGESTRLVGLLTAGPPMHQTCCRYECPVCAGWGTNCERCTDLLLEMADEACNWPDLVVGRAVNAASR